MDGWEEFKQTTLHPAAAEVDQPTGRILRFGSVEDEYAILRDGAALVDRDYASVLEVTGADRAPWLHNLTTNQVKNLGLNEGVYAFATNVQGRIVFDLQVLNRDKRFWCIVNQSFAERALKHLERYIIMEDVAVTQRADDYIRLGLCGAHFADVLKPFGAGHAGTMASLSVFPCAIAGAEVLVVRHDFCGAPGADLFVPADQAVPVWQALSSTDGGGAATPIGDAVVEIARIEAGLPCPLHEITEEVLPAETGQFDRAVSFNKGCYLGQEVVERMRSRGVVARKLSGIRLDGDNVPPPGANVQDSNGAAIGVITSACRSLALGVPVGLAYLKTGYRDSGSEVRVSWIEAGTEQESRGVVAGLPLAGASAH